MPLDAVYVAVPYAAELTRFVAKSPVAPSAEPSAKCPSAMAPVPVLTSLKVWTYGPAKATRHRFAVSRATPSSSSNARLAWTTENSPNRAPPHRFVLTLHPYGVVLDALAPVPIVV